MMKLINQFEFIHKLKRYFQLTVYALLLFIVCNGSTLAATLKVPSQQYATPKAAAAAAADGDIIEIDAGTYTGTGIVATWGKNNLTIRGVNGRAHMNASGVSISNGKSIWLTTGSNITIENIEFSNARVKDKNGAGIRHEGGLLILRNCYFHDNENGFLSSNSADEIVMEYCEFNRNGRGDGYTHNIYIALINKFTLRYSYSHHTNIGHNVKTRARENWILYNRIMDETSGNASYQIDVPNGGLTYIIGNTLHQGVNADNSGMISYGVEGKLNPIQELYVSGNTLVNDRSSGIGIRISGTPTVAKVVNNIFDNLTTAVSGVTTVFENNIQSKANFFVDRKNFDFHLTADSPAISAAGNPGTANGFSLTPIYEYVHPINQKDRINDGALDAGAFEYASAAILPGDVNRDGKRDLSDIILSLLVCASIETGQPVDIAGDVDNNNKIGIAEVIYILQHLAKLR